MRVLGAAGGRGRPRLWHHDYLHLCPLARDLRDRLGGLFGILDVFSFRAIYVIFAVVLTFLLYPFGRGSRRDRISWLDLLWASLGITGGVNIVAEYPKMVERLGLTTDLDVVLGLVTILLIIEATRRTIGIALPLVRSPLRGYVP